MAYLLDTNILVVYVRGNRQAQNLESELRLLRGEHDVVISAVSVGEIKSLAIRNGWGKNKIDKLVNLLNRFLIADVNVEEIMDRYAEIDAFSQSKHPTKMGSFTARNMGKNDLWIAATGSVLNLILVTSDKDFDHLDGEFLKVKRVNLADYL
ncbi:MAG: PIN domain-containing protein [Bacteroidia bacterium]